MVIHELSDVGPVLTVVATNRMLDLRDGETLTFGRGLTDIDLDLHLSDDERLHRRAGHVTAHTDGWTLDNDGRWLHLQVVSLDHPGRDSLAPGERRSIAWRRVRVEVIVGGIDVGFEVLRHGSTDRRSQPAPVSHGALTQHALVVNRAAGYFHALVALCETRLRDPQVVEIPSDAQVALRLSARRDGGGNVTTKAVQRRLDYVREALGLKAPPGTAGSGSERRDARQRLVDVAIGTGTVTASDLVLLDAAP